MALLEDGPRTATITTVGKVKAISLGRNDITELFGEELSSILYRNSMQQSMEKNQSLGKLTKTQQQNIAASMKIEDFAEGQTVLPQGQDIREKLWIVLRGSLSKGSEIIDKNTCLGKDSMMTCENHILDTAIVATKPSAVASISHEEFKQAIGGQFRAVSDINEAVEVFRSVTIFRSCPVHILEQFVYAMQIKTYTAGQIIIEEGTEGDQFYIIKEGTVDVDKNGTRVRSLAKLDYFGERALITNELRSMTISAKGPVECWVLPKQTFLETGDFRESLMQRMQMQDLKYDLQDIHIVSTLGNGSFGDVYLAVGKQPEHLFALKSISKNKVVQHNLYDGINLERELLQEMHHEMILGIFNTYKTERDVYLLTEYIRGMDMFDTIRELDVLDND